MACMMTLLMILLKWWETMLIRSYMMWWILWRIVGRMCLLVLGLERLYALCPCEWSAPVRLDAIPVEKLCFKVCFSDPRNSKSIILLIWTIPQIQECCW